MQTNEFNQAVSSSVLNENMFKKFGVRVNFKEYTREQLEDARNHLRTKLSQTESESKFNDLLANEDYQQDKYMLNLLNTKIKEMLGERKLTKSEKAKKEKVIKKDLKPKKKEFTKRYGKDKGEQVMYAVATNIAKGKKMKKKTNEAKKVDQDNDGDNDFADVQIARMTASGMNKKKAIAKTKNKPYNKKMSEAAKPKCCCEMKGKAKCPVHSKKAVKENRRMYYKMIVEGMKRYIAEDEEAKAENIADAADMVEDFTGWMQKVGQYQTKTMLELSDEIRKNFGQAESEAFKSAVTPVLQQTLEVLTQSREAISKAVASLATGEAPNPMGMPGGMPGNMGMGGGMPGELPPEPSSPDSMNMGGDEFGASDAAAGGAEVAGREMRESREIRRLRRIHEGNSLMSRLSR
jgi:hypothetical protein